MASTASNTGETTWRPKAIIFDLLTALLDSWTLWNASTPSGTEEEGRLWRARYLEITFGQGTYVSYETLVSRAAMEVGVASSAPETLLRNWPSLEAWPEVFEVLHRLKAQGFKLGVVTNCSKKLGNLAAIQAATCSETGEQVAFDTVVTAEESGFYKPVKQAYDAILEAMGVSADEALFVAGSAGDVQGATNAGMRVVWHNQVGLAAKGDAVPLRESRTLDDALRGFI